MEKFPIASVMVTQYHGQRAVLCQIFAAGQTLVSRLLDIKPLGNWANLTLENVSEYENNYSHPDKKN